MRYTPPLARNLSKAALILGAFGLALTGCGTGGRPGSATSGSTTTTAPNGTSVIATPTSDFALRTFGTLAASTGNQNLIYSPYGLDEALTMAYVGAKGDTADEIALALGIDKANPDWEKNRAALAAQLRSSQDGRDLKITDALFIQKNTPVQQAWINNLHDYFGSDQHNVNFQTDDASKALNKWADTNTDGQIKTVTTPPSDTLVDIVNATAFKGEWLTKFDSSQTAAAPFKTLDNQTVSVQMMHKTDNFAYATGDNYAAVRLPYKGGTSMTVILPTDGKFGDVMKSVTAGSAWSGIDSALTNNGGNQKVVLSLPKFSATSASGLIPVLQAVGIKTAFTDSADFSGIFRNMQVNSVNQNAIITLDEAGTKADAVTQIGATATAVAVEAPPVVFNADHGFIYAITDDATKAILFTGQESDPSTK